MAAIDIIKNMKNDELVRYYKYCMCNRIFVDLKDKGVEYSQIYDQCSVILGEFKRSKLHSSNEEFLFSEMWNRMINSNFLNQCWWLSQDIFQTNVSLPYKKDEKAICIETIETIETTNEFIEFMNLEYKLIGSGTKRKVYLSPCKTYVIKIPILPYNLGILENKKEFEVYQNNPNSIYAECYLFENNWLKMEYVKPVFFKKGDNYPDWILNIAECQVGYNLKGELVAYDYGSEI